MSSQHKASYMNILQPKKQNVEIAPRKLFSSQCCIKDSDATTVTGEYLRLHERVNKADSSENFMYGARADGPLPSYCHVFNSSLYISPDSLGNLSDGALSSLKSSEPSTGSCKGDLIPSDSMNCKWSGTRSAGPFNNGNKIFNNKKKGASSMARRNARERNRVKQVNQGFQNLRQHIPEHFRVKKMSKVDTLHCALEYIRSLEIILNQSKYLDHVAPTTTKEEDETTGNNVKPPAKHYQQHPPTHLVNESDMDEEDEAGCRKLFMRSQDEHGVDINPIDDNISEENRSKEDFDFMSPTAHDNTIGDSNSSAQSSINFSSFNSTDCNCCDGDLSAESDYPIFYEDPNCLKVDFESEENENMPVA